MDDRQILEGDIGLGDLDRISSQLQTRIMKGIASASEKRHYKLLEEAKNRIRIPLTFHCEIPSEQDDYEEMGVNIFKKSAETNCCTLPDLKTETKRTIKTRSR